jgi:hypothetical protein
VCSKDVFQYSLSYDKLDFSHDIQLLDNTLTEPLFSRGLVNLVNLVNSGFHNIFNYFFKKDMLKLHNTYVSLRQSSEWGMRGLQGTHMQTHH